MNGSRRLLQHTFALLATIGFASVLLLPLTAQGVSAQVTSLDGISAKRYIVIDADTGEVFVEHNADEEAAMASLTKIFTTIEALERGDLTERITTDNSDLFDSASTTMGFGPDETFSLQDLLYGMMLPSGNDAAHAIARAIGYQDGDTDDQAVQNFVDEMNQRITDMGLTHTHLKNPHGWGVDGHYSTARDLATFTMYALKYPVFRQLIGTYDYTTSDGYYYVTNTNKLLNNYAGLIGGKTGYDDDAGYCLIEVANRDGSTMISVTLDGEAPDIWYQDNATLLDYAFETKAERLASGKQITGDVVSYRDPDAAQILAQSRGGNSIGSAPVAAESPSASVAATPLTEATVASSVDEKQGADSTDGGGFVSGRNAAVISLVALGAVSLAAFCIWKGLEASGRRRNVLIGRESRSEISPPD
jgi:D-alanyl-D-alanine carboxypeptidase (penicillin-binding protein 5/6)